jgi:predicted permease
MDSLIQDVRYATRKLLRTPSFTLIAVLTLALGIGATTAMWAIVDGVLLRPLPYRDPGSVVQVSTLMRDSRPSALSALDFIDYRDQTTSFTGMAAMDNSSQNLTRSGSEPARVQVGVVGANFFDLLGMAPQRGRWFLKGEDDRGANRVIVLGDNLWRTRFGGDTAIVGKAISLDGDAYTVVGIAPPQFSFPERAEAWRPLEMAPWMLDPNNRGAHFLRAIGRVKPGVAVETARQDLLTVSKRLSDKYPETNDGFRGDIEPLQQAMVGPYATALKAMLGAVFFVLLIACANVANLLLVRAATRESEMAVRTALGAGRTRIVRQLVTESVLLAVTGAALGIAVAAWLLVGVAQLAGDQVPRLETVTIDARVLLFAIGMALLTGLIFGLAPAFHAARSGIGQMLRGGSRGSGTPGANRTRSVLVVAELALAMVLLVGAGLLARSFSRLMNVDPGFRPERVLTFRVSLPATRYPDEPQARVFAGQVLAELRQLPGTQDAGVAYFRPFERGMTRTGFQVRGQPAPPRDQRKITDMHPASPTYFSTMGIPVKAGRMFDERENGFGTEPVVVVNEALARKHFPSSSPIGQFITLGVQHDTVAGAPPVTVEGRIIGVVGDIHQRDLKTAPVPTTYVPFNTFAANEMSFVVRTTASPATTSREIRARMRQLDADLPLYQLQTMEEAMSDSASQQRFFVTLLGGFAALALVLSAIGIYGVISYTVAQRTREMGIRIALGATQQRVVKLVVSRGAALAVAGVGIGIAGSAALTRFISGMLFETQALDPMTFGGVAAVLATVAVTAAWLPARRAARVDPVIAMRTE